MMRSAGNRKKKGRNLTILPRTTQKINGIDEASHLDAAGAIANKMAGDSAFTSYRAGLSANTVKAHGEDIDTFSRYCDLFSDTVNAKDLSDRPESWGWVTWGIVRAYQNWMLSEGYATSTVNRKVSTVKRYCKLSMQAGFLDSSEYTRIQGDSGLTFKQAVNVDKDRPVRRMSCKKEQPVRISLTQFSTLLDQPLTPQGIRDRLILCLLGEHGLRVGEAVLLQCDHILIDAGVMSFYRPKVYKNQTHALTENTREVLHKWRAHMMGEDSFLLRGSRRGGGLTHAGMSRNSVTTRVKVLGERIGVHGLSAHDLRHYWTSYWADRVTPFELMQAGGWSSIQTVSRYVSENTVANSGMTSM